MATLAAAELPDTRLTRAEAAAADPKTKAMLRAGARVAIQVVGGPPRDAETFRRRVVEGLTARLRAVGAEVADSEQPIRVVATFQEKDTGMTIEYRKLGTGDFKNAEKRSLPARNLEWALAVADNRGNPVPFAANALGMSGFGIQHLPAGENDWEGYLRAQQWLAAADQVAARDVPFFVARRPGEAVMLPGRTNLGYPQN